nr:immunoglobulin heavy chain junction region [Mus musculus]
CTVYYYAMDYW